VLFHALAAGALMNGARIDALLIETKSSCMAVRADMFRRRRSGELCRRAV
jgi:hypothetical protein